MTPGGHSHDPSMTSSSSSPSTSKAPSFGQISKKTASKFIREVTTETGAKMFQCILCNMTTSHSNSMRRHMVIKHTRPSTHKCQYCAREFSNKFYLINHLSSKICMKDIMFDPWANPWISQPSYSQSQMFSLFWKVGFVILLFPPSSVYVALKILLNCYDIVDISCHDIMYLTRFL